MIATVSAIGSRSLSVAPEAMKRSAAIAWNCMPRPSSWERYSAMTEPSGPTTRNDVGQYQTRSMSIRALVPTIDAALGPAARDDDRVVETAPEAWVMTVATSASAP